jgi:hypothetical protein
VWAYNDDERDLLINEIGSYTGSRPLVGPGSYIFDIDADGGWSVTITPIGAQATISTSGVGDSVSGVFLVSGSTATMTVSHDGSSNFAVWLNCDGGRDLFQNEIGPVSGSRVLQIPRGSSLCFWDVTADGAWSLAAQ